MLRSGGARISHEIVIQVALVMMTSQMMQYH